MTLEELEKWIKHHEGFNGFPYLDSKGILTIGFGRNLDQIGINPDEAEVLFQNDLHRAVSELNYFPWFKKLPENVQNALINMNFNLGFSKLLTFKKMLGFLEKGDFTNAAIEALNSKWANDVGKRAKDVALMMRDGHGTETGADRTY